MLLGALDHSPSEQLSGHPAEWHTTVLVLSEGGEYLELVTDLAQRLAQSSALKKWSDKRNHYKALFEEALAAELPKYPVHIRAISAPEWIIGASTAHMLKELGLANFVRPVVRNEKRYLEFGPFQRVRTARLDGEYPKACCEPASFEVREHQAIPLIFICHFLLRMHQQLMPLMQEEWPELEWVDWQLMPNKFPGGVDGPMASLFHALMSGSTGAGLVAGNIRIMTLLDSKTDAGSALADNVAGLLRDKIACGEMQLAKPTLQGRGASMLWEVWSAPHG